MQGFSNVSLRVTGIAIWALWCTSCGHNDSVAVSVDKVQRRTVTEIVAANGKLRPVTELKLQADVSGEIVELYVREGDSVKQGQLLLEINPDVLQSVTEAAEATLNSAQAQLDAARARLAQSKALLERAEADFIRNKKLHDKHAISDAEFDAARATLESARADYQAADQAVRSAQFGVDQARANLTQAQRNLKRTRVFAPVSGIVSLLAREKGERVVGTVQMEGSEILRIADMSQMQVVVDINENDVVRIQKGDSALVTVDAYPNRVFRGVVTHIANSPRSARPGQPATLSVDEVASFEVKVLILRESYADLLSQFGRYPFKPGMSARVEIITDRVSDVLTVPIVSVTTREDTLSSEPGRYTEYVFVRQGSVVRMRPVKTGIQDNRYIAVLEGLKEGEEVVDGPYGAISRRLADSTKVVVVSRDKLFSGE
jgi:HlyD family secretion protein